MAQYDERQRDRIQRDRKTFLNLMASVRVPIHLLYWSAQIGT